MRRRDREAAVRGLVWLLAYYAASIITMKALAWIGLLLGFPPIAIGLVAGAAGVYAYWGMTLVRERLTL